MKNLILYHNDNDGKLSAMLLYKALLKDCKEEDIELILCDYNLDRGLVPHIFEDTDVYIVDYSLEPQTFVLIREMAHNVIWIDHHISAIDKYEKYFGKEYCDKIDGRRQIGIAACELTELYLKDEKNYMKFVCSEVVKLVGDWDVFKLELTNSRKFRLGSTLYNTDIRTEDGKTFWLSCLDDKSDLLGIVIYKGETLCEFMDKHYAELCKYNSYSVLLVKYPTLKAVAINTAGINITGDVFNTIKDKYDIGIIWYKKGPYYAVELYSLSDNVNVAEIAVQYNGGGHRGAAGCLLEKLDNLFKL